MNTEPLPEYEIDPQDELIVYHLLDDELFKQSIESEYGKIVHIYADWRSDHLVYEFLDGSSKYSTLSEIIKTLKDLGYLSEFMH